MFFMFSESALNSAEKRQNSETALFSAESRWDFNPGALIELEVTKFSGNEKRISSRAFKDEPASTIGDKLIFSFYHFFNSSF